MVLGAVFSRPWEASNKMAADGQGRVRDYVRCGNDNAKMID